MMGRIQSVILLIVLLSATFASAQTPATMNVLYGVTESPNRDINALLMTIDTATGVATVLASSQVADMSTIAINSSGSVYATDATYLYRVDAATASTVNVGFITNDDIAAFWMGLAFDENDVLYAISRTGVLAVVDTSTARLTIVGETNVINLWSIAFDPTDGTLYAGNGSIDAIYSIDKDEAIASLVGFTDLRRGVRGIAFDGKGTMFGTSEGEDFKTDLIIIDKHTGLGTPVGNTGVANVAGVRMLPDLVTAIGTPAPPSQWLTVRPNVPNPFNPATAIRYVLDVPARVRVAVYDVSGRRVWESSPASMGVGAHAVRWDGRDAAGSASPSGVYFYRVFAEGTRGQLVRSGKMTLLK